MTSLEANGANTKERRLPGWLNRKLVGGIAIIGAAAASFLSINELSDSNEQLRNEKAELFEELDVHQNLSKDGLRFNYATITAGGRTLVGVPADACVETDEIAFQYEAEGEEWTLSLQQTDEAENVFDTGSARTRGGVEELVNDYCGND
ncbi:MAG: hypothetical protein U5L95_02745 [Candidatus Saccharibacteria bacterium]|nr:hypothetical protein [Candidatus Saccharibacteria bacterium]